MKNENPKAVRLQLFLARAGIGSRRTCEKYISQGRVSVNGRTITAQGVKVNPSDTVYFNGKLVIEEKRNRYIAVHKPAGYLCSNADPFARPLVKDLFTEDMPERLFHVGRLDYWTGGLIFYTNDGNFAAFVSHPSSGIEKEYMVRTDQPIPDSLLLRFRQGIEIDNVFYRLKSYRRITAKKVTIILVEGKNREIRKVFEADGLRIRELKRLRIGPVTLDGLAEGKYRELTRRERNVLIAKGVPNGGGD